MELVMTDIHTKPDLTLDLNPELFTEVYRKIETAKSRFVIVYGGASASKSYSMLQHIVASTFTEKSTWLCIRKYGTDIQNSIYENLVGIINEWEEISRFFTFKLSPFTITNKLSGSRIIFRGLDDTEKIKSIYGIKRIFIEEANQLTYDDFRELNRRARGMEGIQIYLVFNPVVITHWLKEQLFDNPFYQAHCTYIHATYKDAAKWLTEDDIIQLEMLKDINPNDYKVYCLGEWGKVRTGNEFYYNFIYNRHISPVEITPDRPIHISFDQNVVPYITCLVSQIIEDDNGVWHLNILDELCLKNPQNNTEALCREVMRRYEPYLSAGLFYYGDATGRKRDTRGTENDYDIVERVLARWLSPASCRVPYNNPLIVKRRDFINRILSNKYNIRIAIHPDCRNLITDIEMVQEDAEGKKFKKKKTDREGASYEELGHTSDAADYLIMSAFENYIQLI